MTNRFEGKVAIVTGGGRGIGEALSLLLAREGAKVVVADLGGAVRGGGADASIAQAVVDAIGAAGGTAIACAADVASMEGARSVTQAAIDAFGRIDILFNGAGILRRGKIDEMEEHTWDEVIRVNLKSVYAMARHVTPHMKLQRGGSMSAYAASKEGLVAFTRSIARELGEFGIRCNAIRPCAGTRMFLAEIADDMRYVTEELGVPPVGECWLPGMNGEDPEGGVDHTAAVVAWLCAPETAALNGRTLYIAGGHLALCAEPELVRSRYLAGGWTLDALLQPSVLGHFTYGQRNHFPPRGA
jgi:3-oxoacyl-[acyl-carrier protein] reductase